MSFEDREKARQLTEERERALLVGVDTGEEEDFDYSIEELKSLAEACDMEVVGICTQRMERVNKAHYIGTGKIDEVKEFAELQEADIIIFDNSLTPSQLRNLQKLLEKPVMDRTALILDIFSSRAKTREAKLQVETARLQYLLSRLVGMHEALTRQGGTSGSMSSRGAGEKKLELDRRRIEHRLVELNKELEEVKKERETQRKKRVQSKTPKISLVGYTNAGKSTIMNQMVEAFVGETEKKVFEKDMLFATLDTTVRNIQVGNNQDFMLSDTVGFIHKLPHALVKAFRSTLEEIKTADLILYVIDYSDPHYKQHIETTNETLRELEAGDIPVLYVYNKVDKVAPEGTVLFARETENAIYISAKNKEDIQKLVNKIISKVYGGYVDAVFIIPYTQGGIASLLQEKGIVEAVDYLEEGTQIKGRFHVAEINKYCEYIQK